MSFTERRANECQKNATKSSPPWLGSPNRKSASIPYFDVTSARCAFEFSDDSRRGRISHVPIMIGADWRFCK